MQTVLVTGANGFFGRILVPILRKDARVIAAIRRGTFTDAETRVVGDLSTNPDLAEALQGVDCIVHCAARAHVLREDHADPLAVFMKVNCDATLNLARAAARTGVKRFVFLSSIGVNGNQTSGTPYRAGDAPAPNAPYAVSKLAAEQGLAHIASETGLEVVIIRPPLIIGPEPVGNLGTLARMIGKGIPLPFGRATSNRRSLVSAEVLADLVRVCLTHPAAAGAPLLVANARPMSTRDILETLARITGQKLRIFPFPVFLLRAGLRILGRKNMDVQLFGNLEIDITETTARLDWRPQA